MELLFFSRYLCFLSLALYIICACHHQMRNGMIKGVCISRSCPLRSICWSNPQNCISGPLFFFLLFIYPSFVKCSSHCIGTIFCEIVQIDCCYLMKQVTCLSKGFFRTKTLIKIREKSIQCFLQKQNFISGFSLKIFITLTQECSIAIKKYSCII